ncbi:hypothetical protein ACFFTM_02440 [Pseudoduganella plicata]|nr:hypothetical protein E1742_12280 [Pseudoduganella plicata]
MGRLMKAINGIGDGLTRLVSDVGQSTHTIHHASGAPLGSGGNVSNVSNFSGIIGEITVAGKEQSSGIEQINRAITAMDNTTQQNAALVEQAAAAAQSMQDQAAMLESGISVFKLRAGTAVTAQRGLVVVWAQ